MLSEEECIKYTSECWDKGFNCAESAMRGLCLAQEIALPEVALMMATPFGGGFGCSEDTCGALTGGLLGIGAKLGRTEAKVNKDQCYKAAKELHGCFVRKFKTTQCKALNKGDFNSQEHEQRCKEFVLESTRMAYRILSKT